MKIKNKMYIHKLLPSIFCGLSIPLSMFMWMGDSDFSKLSDYSNTNRISYSRWVVSILLPVLLMGYGFKRKGVNKSGAFFGSLFGIIFSIANFAFFTSFAMFYITASRVTKFRSEEKKKFEENFKEGGQRGWIPVLCNVGMAAQLAVLYLIYCGSGEQPIDFLNLYRSSWLGIAVVASFACCNGDTWAGELGSVIGSSSPVLITTFKKVPLGTNGGVTIIELLVSMLGGLAIGIAYYITVICTVDSSVLGTMAPQWPTIFVGVVAAFMGSIINSILSAILQYSGIDENGHIVEAPGRNIKHISGFRVLDNHNVNLISSILTGIITPSIALKCWPQSIY